MVVVYKYEKAMCIVVLEQLSCMDCYCNDQIVLESVTLMRFVDSSRWLFVQTIIVEYKRDGAAMEKDCNRMALGIIVELCESVVARNSMAANFRVVASSKSAILIFRACMCPILTHALAIKRRADLQILGD